MPYAKNEILNRTKSLIAKTPANIHGYMADDLIVLDIVGKEVHYWSPQLNFRVEEDEDQPEHSIVRGLIGPKPSVWTLFMFIYGVIGTLGFFVCVFAISKYMVGEKLLLFISLPATVIILLSAYATSKYGEKLAADQIEILKQFVGKVIDFDSSEV